MQAVLYFMVEICLMNPDRKSIGEIPVDTYHAARQVYNLKHIYLLIGDQLDDILAKIDLPMLDPRAYQDRATIARLAMVTAFQHAELLPDVVASDATRKRMDWKYALRLPVHHQGVSEAALCAFRQGLYESRMAAQEYECILQQLKQVGLFGVNANMPLNSEEVLLNVCQITRLYRLYTGMKAALGVLVSTAPNWVRTYMPPTGTSGTPPGGSSSSPTCPVKKCKKPPYGWGPISSSCWSVYASTSWKSS